MNYKMKRRLKSVRTLNAKRPNNTQQLNEDLCGDMQPITKENLIDLSQKNVAAKEAYDDVVYGSCQPITAKSEKSHETLIQDLRDEINNNEHEINVKLIKEYLIAIQDAQKVGKEEYKKEKNEFLKFFGMMITFIPNDVLDELYIDLAEKISLYDDLCPLTATPRTLKDKIKLAFEDNAKYATNDL